MATRLGVQTTDNNRAVKIIWEGLLQTSSDVGDGALAGHNADKSVQVVGTFSTGGEITMEGSNDGTTWSTLHDPQGNDLLITDSEFKLIAENPLLIRPRVSGGDGSTDLDVILSMAQNAT